jgi:phosphoglycolate phosphatase-like HAD superfamily hydrolase
MEIELLDHLFDSVITANVMTGIEEKPSPEGLFRCLEQMEINIEHTIMVGNGLEDVLAGQAAEVTDVLIDRGRYSSNVVPTYRINSLMKLKDLFFN